MLYIADIKGIKNIPELAVHLGYDSAEKLYRLKRSSEAKPSVDILNDFTNKFEDLNIRWLLNGRGEPFEKIAPKIAPIIAPNDKNLPIKQGNVPAVVAIDRATKEEAVTLVPVKAAAGYLNGYADPEFIEKLPTIDIPGLSGQTHRAFEVRGQSMPTQHSGSIAIGRWVESLDQIKDRRVYILLTKFDGIVLKRVLNRLNTDGKLILMSDNDNKREYPNYPVSPEDILEVWYWRGGIIREIPEPGSTYTRINDLEGRLTLLEQRLNSR